MLHCVWSAMKFALMFHSNFWLATEHFLLQPLVCGTVFHRTSLLSPPLSPSSPVSAPQIRFLDLVRAINDFIVLCCIVVLSHISSHFLIPLSDSSLSCTVPAQWFVILDTIIVTTCTSDVYHLLIILTVVPLMMLVFYKHYVSMFACSASQNPVHFLSVKKVPATSTCFVLCVCRE